VQLLLRRMSGGGIYDHLGGGFARYATDAAWLVPHFEKMLYDNAQILELLALVHARNPERLFAERAAETVGWLVRDMRVATRLDSPTAAFAASEDADSEGEEGRFYVWTEDEIDRLLGARSGPFKRAYDVTRAGNWDGRVILRRIREYGTAAEEEALAAARRVLFAARGQRSRPMRDDKVLADWNGLAVAALCRAGSVFGQPDWVGIAASAFDFILSTMTTPDGRIAHAWRLGSISAAGLLDDQAAMVRAAIALFETTGEADRLAQARTIAEAAMRHFGDIDGSFFTTATDAPDVPMTRPRTAADGATPAGNGLMAEALARLFHLTGETVWRDRAESVITTFSGATEQFVTMPTILAATDTLEAGTSVVVAGDAAHPLTGALLHTALGAADPAISVLRASDDRAVPVSHPAHGKNSGRPAAYVCRNQACSAPVDDPLALAELLRSRAAGPALDTRTA
jgi:uncharacterized protein YyaL (SSP411 family)